MMKLIFVGLSVALCCQIVRGQTCSIDTLLACMDNMVDPNMNASATDDSFSLNDQLIDSICSNYESDVRGCMDTKLEGQCDSFTQGMGYSLRDMLDYVCGQGRSGLKQHGPCLYSETVVNRGEACSASLISDFGTLGLSGLGQLLDGICMSLKTILACINEIIEEQCGCDAVVFADTLVKKAAEMVEIMQCDMEELEAEECSRGCTATASWMLGAVIAYNLANVINKLY